MRIAVSFDWAAVGDIHRSPARRLIIPEVAAGPGIYRFRISGGTGAEVYIGESENLRRRMSANYASTHTGQTNVRVREWLHGNLDADRSVELAIVCNAVLAIDGEPIAADLRQADTRLLIENAALILARRAGDRVQNRLRAQSSPEPVGT